MKYPDLKTTFIPAFDKEAGCVKIACGARIRVDLVCEGPDTPEGLLRRLAVDTTSPIVMTVPDGKDTILCMVGDLHMGKDDDGKAVLRGILHCPHSMSIETVEAVRQQAAKEVAEELKGMTP